MDTDIESQVTRVIELAFLISSGSDLLDEEEHRNRFCAKRGASLSKHCLIVRRVLQAREAIAHAESTGDLDGARKLFDPRSPWLHRHEDDGLFRDLPGQLEPLFDVRQGVITEEGLTDLLERTANAIDDPFLQKLALSIGVRVGVEADAWDVDAEAMCQNVADGRGLSDFDFADWFENLVHPLVTGAPADNAPESGGELEGIAQQMQKIVDEQDGDLTDEERKEVEELIALLSGTE